MDIKEKLAAACVNTCFDEPMSRHTTFKIGGNADIFCEPTSIDEIKAVIQIAKSENLPYTIIGNGSDLLVKDNGIKGIVLKIGDKMNDIKVCETKIYAQSGALLSRLSKEALKHSLTGMEGLSGIPGTVGGAIYMNAGAYGYEVSQIIKSVTYITADGEIKTSLSEELGFSYRKSLFTNSDYIILYCEMELEEGNYNEINEKMQDFTTRRVQKQPINLPSAGSTFKRPEGYFAGKLIEDCGLKGFSIGGAEVSELHAGFVVNKNNATASDVIALIEHIQKEVYNKFNVHLETEVKIIGD